MHTLLEAYLSEVAAHLSSLPVGCRDEELREMRTHLENAVLVNREQGQTEDEAARAAIAQFGPARDLGENVTCAWRRGEDRQNRRSLHGAAACTLAVRFFVPLFLSPLMGVSGWPLLASDLGGPIAAGAVSGFLFPRRAVAGTGIGLLAHFCLILALGGYWLAHQGQTHPAVSVSVVVWNLTGQFVTGGGVSLLSAWAGSRWRKSWERPVRLARG